MSICQTRKKEKKSSRDGDDVTEEIKGKEKERVGDMEIRKEVWCGVVWCGVVWECGTQGPLSFQAMWGIQQYTKISLAT